MDRTSIERPWYSRRRPVLPVVGLILAISSGGAKTLFASWPNVSQERGLEMYLEEAGHATDPASLRGLLASAGPGPEDDRLSSEVIYQIWAAEILGRRGYPGSCSTLLAVAADSRRLAELRMEAARALGRLGALDTARGLLRELLQEAMSVEVEDRKACHLRTAFYQLPNIATFLGELGDFTGYPAMIERVRSGQSGRGWLDILAALRWGDLPEDLVEPVTELTERFLEADGGSWPAVDSVELLVAHYGVPLARFEAKLEALGSQRAKDLLAQLRGEPVRQVVGRKLIWKRFERHRVCSDEELTRRLPQDGEGGDGQ